MFFTHRTSQKRVLRELLLFLCSTQDKQYERWQETGRVVHPAMTLTAFLAERGLFLSGGYPTSLQFIDKA